MKPIQEEFQFSNLNKMILEFTQDETNKIFDIGNIVTFFVKSGGVIHPIKLGIIANPLGESGDTETKANMFFAKNLSDFPIDVKGNIFLITQPQQDIRTGQFRAIIIGKEGPNGFERSKKLRQYTFKDIFKVDARTHDNKLIDSYYSNDHEKSSDETDNSNRKIVEFIDFIDELASGEKILLDLINGKSLELIFIDKKGSIGQFELDKNGELPSEYKSFENSSSIEISLVQDQMILNKNNSINLKARYFNTVNGEVKSVDGVINNISDWSIGDEAEPSNDDETSDDVTRKAEDMMKAILNDPLMKKAFYSQPSLWNMIVSAIKGKNPKGTGIVPAWDIVHKYGVTKQQKALGPNGKNFKPNKQAQFEVMYQELVINATGLPQDALRLSPSPSRYVAMVQPYKVGGDERLTLENKKQGFKIRVLKPYKDVPDTFEASVIKTITSKTTGEVKEYPKSAIIKFNNENGSGYSKLDTKTELKPEIKTNNPK